MVNTSYGFGKPSVLEYFCSSPLSIWFPIGFSMFSCFSLMFSLLESICPIETMCGNHLGTLRIDEDMKGLVENISKMIGDIESYRKPLGIY